jgi:acyl carrier protein
MQGIPGTSIAWGAWGGIGMAAGDSAVIRRLEHVGVASMQPAVGLEALAVVLRPAIASGTLVMAAAVKWERVLSGSRQRMHFYGELAMDHQPVVNAAKAVEKEAGSALLYPLAEGVQAGPVAARPTMEELHEKVATVVSSTLGKAVGGEEPLLAAGLDSLGAVEVRRSLAALSGLDLPATLVFDYPTVNAIATQLAAAMPQVAPDEVQQGAVAADGAVVSMQAQLARTVRPVQATSAAPSVAEVLMKVQSAVEGVLGRDDIAPNAPLMATGLDSLGTIELRKELTRYEYPVNPKACV